VTTKAHEIDDGRAVLITDDGKALYPLFPSKVEAESFLSYIGNTDAAELGWRDGFPDGPRLIGLWAKEGKPSQRKPPVIGASYLNKPDPDEDDPEDVWGRRWSFIVDFHDLICFPLFVGIEGGNHEIGELLKREGVVTDADHPSHESGGFYAYFDTKKAGLAFLKRLNAWIRANWSKAYDAN